MNWPSSPVVALLGAVAFVLSAPMAAGSGVDALVAKGDALDQRLKTKEALAVFLEAEKIAPNEAGVLRRVAKGYAELMTDVAARDAKRDLGLKAVEYARRAVAAEPRDAQAHLALAICYGRVAPLLDSQTKINHSKLVKEHVDKSLALDPSSDYAYHVLGVWNYELAGLNPVLRAVAKLIYGGLPAASYDDAVKNFKKSIELAPQRVSHHVELGRTYAAMGQTEPARASLNKGLALPNREKDDAETKERARATLKKL